MNTPKTFIFVGRSGCGKGTQLKLLREYISSIDKENGHFAFATGDGFRAFFNKESYASELAKDITAKGELQPLFLTITLWGSAFIESLKPTDHMFIDGYPRVEAEAIAVSSALSFFQREKPIIIDFIVSRETSKNRMLTRGRVDDTEENTETRLNWYERDVVPAVEYLKKQDGYIYLAVDGEKSIEEIHESVISLIKPYL